MGTAKVRITQVRARQIDAVKSRARSEHFAKVKTAEVDRVIPRTLGGSENEFVFWVRHLKTHLPPNDQGNPAAANDLRFQNPPDPPLGLTALLSGIHESEKEYSSLSRVLSSSDSQRIRSM